jgi:DNA/RNA endonuclease YhcR with UshA esterase domain
MKKLTLLSASLCYFIAAVAMAADAPGSKTAAAPQPPSAAGTVPEHLPAAKPAEVSSYTIEELYGKSAELGKKRVVVHGRAVKVTSGIMGKIWTHIQDGTGDKNKGTNDLICISAATDEATVGDLVTITGTVILKPGTRYPVTLGDATISK